MRRLSTKHPPKIKSPELHGEPKFKYRPTIDKKSKAMTGPNEVGKADIFDTLSNHH